MPFLAALTALLWTPALPAVAQTRVCAMDMDCEYADESSCPGNASNLYYRADLSEAGCGSPRWIHPTAGIDDCDVVISLATDHKTAFNMEYSVELIAAQEKAVRWSQTSPGLPGTGASRRRSLWRQACAQLQAGGALHEIVERQDAAARRPAPSSPPLDEERMQRMIEKAVAKAAGANSQPAPSRAEPQARVSDVDRPGYRFPERPKDFAVVVGVGRYKRLPEAEYAERDARAVREHLLALGVPSANLIHLAGEEATRAQLQGYLEEWLPKNVEPGSRLYFYYSGHGAPDPSTGDAYLVPWDGDPMFLKSTAYPVRKLYRQLASLGAKEVAVVLDACFSGAGGRSVLPKGARPLVMKLDEKVAADPRVTLLAAASGDEITGSLPEQGHGAFTYYLLKALQARPASLSAAFSALKPEVQGAARRQNRFQTPVFKGPDIPLR